MLSVGCYLSDKFFIDYLQLFIKTNQTQSVVLNYLLSRLPVKEIDTVKVITDDEYFYCGDGIIKYHLRGSAFKSPDFNKNIKEIKSYLKKWFNRTMFTEPIISRLDIAFNDYGQIMKNYYFRNTYNSEVTEIRKNNYTETVYLGKRNNKSPFYRCYDKRKDLKGHLPSIMRFGTVEYNRHEYELKRDYLRERKINVIKDIKKDKIKEILVWLVENKSISFISPKYLQKHAHPPTKISNGKADQTRLHKQVKGIYLNNFTEKEFKNSANKIGEYYNGKI